MAQPGEIDAYQCPVPITTVEEPLKDAPPDDEDPLDADFLKPVEGKNGEFIMECLWVRDITTDQRILVDARKFLDWYDRIGERIPKWRYLTAYVNHMQQAMTYFAENPMRTAEVTENMIVDLGKALRAAYNVDLKTLSRDLKIKASLFVSVRTLIDLEMIYAGMDAQAASRFLKNECFAPGTWLIRTNPKPWNLPRSNVFVLSIKDNPINEFSSSSADCVSHYRFVDVYGAGVFQWPYASRFETLAEMYILHSQTKDADPKTLIPVARSTVEALLAMNPQQFAPSKLLMPYHHPDRVEHP